MGKTTILGIDELAQGQTQAFTTVNDAIAAIEQATNSLKTITATGAYTIPDLDFIRFREFRFTSLTANANLTLPTTINGNTTDREIVIVNATNYVLTVLATANIAIPPQSGRVIRVAGNTKYVVGEFGVVTGIPHTTAFFAAGHPTHDAEVLRYVFPERVTWAAGLTGSVGSVRVAPSPGTRFYLYKNGSKIGDAIISTGGLVTFTAASAVSWAIGDVLTVKFQALETGTITFSLVPDTADTVTIDDGATSVVFTFGGGLGQVAPGATAAAAATNLKAAIEASSLASTIAVGISSNVLTIVNLLSAGGGAITKSDADNDYVIVDFTQDATSEDYGVTFYGTRS